MFTKKILNALEVIQFFKSKETEEVDAYFHPHSENLIMRVLLKKNGEKCIIEDKHFGVTLQFDNVSMLIKYFDVYRYDVDVFEQEERVATIYDGHDVYAFCSGIDYEDDGPLTKNMEEVYLHESGDTSLATKVKLKKSNGVYTIADMNYNGLKVFESLEKVDEFLFKRSTN